MKRAEAILAFAAMALLTALSFAAPGWVAALLALLALAYLPSGRAAFLLFAGSAVAMNALVFWLVRGDVLLGLVAAARLAAALGANLAIVGRIGAARLLDGLRLPARLTALLAAVVLAARDVGADFERMREAQRLDGDWPARRLARARAAAALVPPLFLAAERRARMRRDALQLAGHPTAPWFVPLVAVAALAAAGRMAFLALPNVALTFVVVFLGGMLYGPFVGAAGALLGMAITDLMLSGLYPLGFVNAPAMALLALAGAAMRRFDFERFDGLVFAFLAGAFGTMLFSVATDTATWLFVAPGDALAWRALVVAGLAFNVLPAIANGVLFSASVAPVARAFRALREGGRPSGPTPAVAPRVEPPASPAPPN